MGIDQQKKGKIRFLFVISIVFIDLIASTTITITMMMLMIMTISLPSAYLSLSFLIPLRLPHFWADMSFLFIYFVEVVHNGTQLLLPVCIAIKS